MAACALRVAKQIMYDKLAGRPTWRICQAGWEKHGVIGLQRKCRTTALEHLEAQNLHAEDRRLILAGFLAGSQYGVGGGSRHMQIC